MDSRTAYPPTRRDGGLSTPPSDSEDADEIHERLSTPKGTATRTSPRLNARYNARLQSENPASTPRKGRRRSSEQASTPTPSPARQTPERPSPTPLAVTAAQPATADDGNLLVSKLRGAKRSRALEGQPRSASGPARFASPRLRPGEAGSTKEFRIVPGSPLEGGAETEATQTEATQTETEETQTETFPRSRSLDPITELDRLEETQREASPDAPEPVLKFTNFAPEVAAARTIDNAICEILKKDVTKTDLDEGWGYVYLFPCVASPKHCKIGFTKNDVKLRRSQIEDLCGVELDLCSKEGESFQKRIPYFSRVESLVHAELQNERRNFECGGPNCPQGKKGAPHSEYFEIDYGMAERIVERWRCWVLNSCPYDVRTGQLDPWWVKKLLLKPPHETPENKVDSNSGHRTRHERWEAWLQPQTTAERLWWFSKDFVAAATAFWVGQRGQRMSRVEMAKHHCSKEWISFLLFMWSQYGVVCVTILLLFIL